MNTDHDTTQTAQPQAMSPIPSIKNYTQYNDWIHTSGQPEATDFVAIASLGVTTVINLAMPDHKTALAHEGALVTSLGMTYVHIPVVWDAPQVPQFTLFCQIMQAQGRSPVWVHCALNWRVSCFMYLYARMVLNQPASDAEHRLHSLWQPNACWQNFITAVLTQSD